MSFADSPGGTLGRSAFPLVALPSFHWVAVAKLGIFLETRSIVSRFFCFAGAKLDKKKPNERWFIWFISLVHLVYFAPVAMESAFFLVSAAVDDGSRGVHEPLMFISLYRNLRRNQSSKTGSAM